MAIASKHKVPEGSIEKERPYLQEVDAFEHLWRSRPRNLTELECKNSSPSDIYRKGDSFCTEM